MDFVNWGGTAITGANEDSEVQTTGIGPQLSLMLAISTTLRPYGRKGAMLSVDGAGKDPAVHIAAPSSSLT